jgi:hypothetical protein
MLEAVVELDAAADADDEELILDDEELILDDEELILLYFYFSISTCSSAIYRYLPSYSNNSSNNRPPFL